jgi:hypothetical protein
MKDKRSSPVDKIIPILMVLGFSMFCGIIGTAGGPGTLTSPLNQIAGPTVCGEQSLEIESDSSVYIQGEGTHQVTAYCVDKGTGEKQDVSIELSGAIRKLQFVSGIILTLIVFALAMLFLHWAARRLGKSFAELFQPSVRRT